VPTPLPRSASPSHRASAHPRRRRLGGQRLGGPRAVPGPLSFDWDGEALLIATPADSPTGRNLAATGAVRLGLGHTRDVSTIEGEVEVLEIDALPQRRGDRFAARTGFDLRALATPYRWFCIFPRHPGLARGGRAAWPRADARRPLGGLTPRPGAPCGRGSQAAPAGATDKRAYCSKLVRPGQTGAGETAKAAPPNRWRHDKHGHEDGHAAACAARW
jgi:hypothetical protein